MEENQQTGQLEAATATGMSRRAFFGLAGGLAGAGLLMGATGCNTTDDDKVDLPKDDLGILNFAFVLEQLEAAFYTQVVATPFNGMTAQEKLRFTEIRDHEIAHREYFRAALGNNAVRDVECRLDSIDFASRDSVLAAAKAFEDLGVSAYNGAGPLISDVNYLIVAGKISSVEARHAAYVRDLMLNGSFAAEDVVDGNGLDVSRTPVQVMAIAQKYLYTQINVSALPTS